MNGRLLVKSIAVLLLSACSLTLVVLSFPPNPYWWLGLVSLVPLALICTIVGPAACALSGILVGLASGWVLAGPLDSAGQSANLNAAFGGLGIVFGLSSAFAAFAWDGRIRPAAWPFFVAAVGISLEFVCGHLFPVNFAVSQHCNPAALMFASCTGIWGVSFLLWLTGGAVAVLVRKPKAAVPALVVSVLFIGASFAARLPRDGNGPSVRAAAVQALDSYSSMELTEKAKGKADVAVWGEQLMDPGEKLAPDAAIKSGMYVVASYNIADKDGEYRNTARLISPKGEVVGSFKKRHLFGKEVLSFKPGEEAVPVRTPLFVAGMPVCFDTMFTDANRELVANGANILLVPNSDPDFRNLLFNHLHSAITAFRAAENGVPLVWTEGAGVSSIFDRHGRRVARAKTAEPEVVIATVELGQGRTIYNRLGDWLPNGCIVVLVAMALYAGLARFRTRRDHQAV
jgi:apolipoprotein N-acyltransferase